MPKKQNNCDCELCIHKTLALDTTHLTKDKIIEAILYHFIFRLGNLVKSKKELNSQAIKFVGLIDQSYLTSSSLDLNQTINLLYKKIIDFGKGCSNSTATSFTKLMHKEVTYLKLIIHSIEDNKEVVVEKEVVEKEVVEDISKVEKEVVEDIKTLQTDVVEDIAKVEKDLVEDIKTLQTDVVEDIKILQKDMVEGMKEIMVSLIEENIVVDKKEVPDASGSYYSYCVIS